MNIINPIIAQFFILYGLYLLLPMIPSVIIYKIFPDTKIAVSGPLQGLTIKATGAFAAYLICCLVGYPIVSGAKNAISLEQEGNYVWQVNAKVNLIKSDDKTPLTAEEAYQYLKRLSPAIKPSMITIDENYVSLFIPERMMQMASITFQIEGFQPKVIKKEELDKAKQNTSTDKTINLGEINLRQFNVGPVYNPVGNLTPVSSLPNQPAN